MSELFGFGAKDREDGAAPDWRWARLARAPSHSSRPEAEIPGEPPRDPEARPRSWSACSPDAVATDRELLLKKEWLWEPDPAAPKEQGPAAAAARCPRARGCVPTLGMAGLGLLLACWSLAFRVPATCAQYGCGSSGLAQRCRCHPDCIVDGSCCPDYGEACAEPGSELILAPPEEASCAAYGCVGFVRENACQCGTSCGHHGNCCGDYSVACADGVSGSCAVYGCSLERREHPCQCYPDCAHEGDCCKDYVDTCRGKTFGIIATRRTSTETSTTVTRTSTTTTRDPDADPVPLEPFYDAPPPGFDGYALFYDGDNPLRIRPSETRGENYFLLLGDWGTPGAPGECQAAVAEAMRQYAAEQKDAGMRLLFVGTVGDNFYWTGVKPESWDASWSAPYGANDPGSPLFQVPWLATLGNHDYGNDDTFAFCPGARSEFSIHGQPYAARQLNRDRNPTRPKPSELNTTHYWLPDYSYHYSIPEADLEVIAFDTNAGFVDILGGDEGGNKKAFSRCGGRDAAADFLSRVERASVDLLARRAREGTARTVVLLQHYPGRCQREVFVDALSDERRGQVRVLCAYGHVHDQRCEGEDDRGVCDTIMTGGGGGCCPSDLQAGFTAVRLTEDGGFEVDVESARVKLPPKSCRWKVDVQV